MAVYVARYDRVTPSRHLNVLHQDGLAATYTYAVNRQECFLAVTPMQQQESLLVVLHI
jgi:hypothetical protein